VFRGVLSGFVSAAALRAIIRIILERSISLKASILQLINHSSGCVVVERELVVVKRWGKYINFEP
jgi:hypothetical protein